MSRPNRYRVTCVACAKRVEPGMGALVGDPPDAYCRACIPGRSRSASAVEWAMGKHGKAPFPYQRAGNRWLTMPHRLEGGGAILADEQGLGKTIQALMSVPLRSKLVVVCPRVAKTVWADHIRDYRPDIEVVKVCAGRTGRRAFGIPPKRHAAVTNFAILPAWLSRVWLVVEAGGNAADAVRKHAPHPGILDEPIFVLVDEAHYAKSSTAARSHRTGGLCALARATGGASWLLTGTPLKNRPPDLYNLLKIAGLASVTWPSFRAFAEDMGGERQTVARGRRAWVWTGAVRAHVPDVLRRVMLRREKRDVLTQLPPKTYETITVPIPGAARESADRALRALEGLGIDLASTTASALLHAARGPAFDELSRACRDLAVAKIPASIDITDGHLASGGLPPLVWSRHVDPVKAVGGRDGWMSIHGGTTGLQRDRAQQRFMAGDLRGLALSIKAAATAITLTATDRAFFIDREWSPADNEQAEDRIHRIGQHRPCLYTRIVAEHALDRRLDELLTEKALTTSAAISAARVVPTGGIGV